MQAFLFVQWPGAGLISKILGGWIPQVELLVDESSVHLSEDQEGIRLGPKGKSRSGFRDKDIGVLHEKYGHFTACLDHLLCTLCGQWMGWGSYC